MKRRAHPLSHQRPSGRWIVAVCLTPAQGYTGPQLGIVTEEDHLRHNEAAITQALAAGTPPDRLWSALETATSLEDALKFRRAYAQTFKVLMLQAANQ